MNSLLSNSVAGLKLRWQNGFNTKTKNFRHVEHSRRYRADLSGIRTMCDYLLLRDKVIKPPLVGVIQPIGRAPKNIGPLDKH